MDANKMREMREAFERTNSRDHRRHPPKGNNYIDPMAQADWESFQKGWQASREAVVVELPKVVGFEGAYDSHRHHEFVPSMSDVEDADEIFGLCRRVEAKEAIEAHGLKVAP